MRDINRIDKVTNELNKLWKKYPDMRFGQLIHTIYFNANDHPRGDRDKFYVEDDVWLEVIERLNNSK
jgi:hypothetical protein